MVSTELYDGDVVLKFDDNNHQYNALVDGEELVDVPSATTVTGVVDKPALRYWAVNETVDFLRDKLEPGTKYDEVELNQLLDDSKKARFKTSGRATKIGSLVHDWFEDYANFRIDGVNPSIGGPDEEADLTLPYNEEARKSINAFLDWKENHDIEWLKAEDMIFSREFEYAGTYDAKAIVDGKRTIIDFKTSKGIYPEYWLQGACYASADMEETDDNIEQIMILRVPKFGGEFECATCDNPAEIQEHFETFRAALKIYRWKEIYD